MPVLPRTVRDVAVPADFGRVTAVSPDGSLAAGMSRTTGIHRLILENVPLYGILWMFA